MKVGLVSDLHIDISGTDDLILPGGELLLLGGDLCEVEFLMRSKRRKKALREQLSKYDRVVAVLGNHEYYGGDFSRVADQYRNELPEVILLEDSHIPLTDNTIIFGGTLWTDLKHLDPLQELRAKDWSDYLHIYNYGERLTPRDTCAAHRRTLDALQKCAADNRDKDIVVLTHFVPSGCSCDSRYIGHVDNAFFYSSLEYIMLDNHNIKTWAHGHTHDSYDYTIGDCRVMCNPRGYHSMYGSEDTGFNLNFNFEVR